jgi:putative membrane protein
MVVPVESSAQVSTTEMKAARVDDPRVYLAAERTFLAWIRTSLALMGFGFLIARFALLMRETEGLTMEPRPRHPAISPWLGFAMVCFGVAICLTALARHRTYVRALEAGVANPPLDVRTTLVIAGILALVGLAMAVHILML